MSLLTVAAAAASLAAPHPVHQADTSYLYPKACVAIDSPMPVMLDSSLVTGIYYNILYPEERQNACKPLLRGYFADCLKGKTPDFLTEDQLETINSYSLQNVPKQALVDCSLAPITLQHIREGKSIQYALQRAIEKIKSDDIPIYQAILDRLQSVVKRDSAIYKRYEILIASITECVQTPEKAFEMRAKTFEKEYEKKGIQKCIELLENWGVDAPSTLSENERHLELFENRRRCMVQAIKDIRSIVPNGGAFLAIQEATPDAVEELKRDLKEQYPTWISFNNLTGQETQVKKKEEVCFESTAFTSTVALSPELKVHRVALGTLPSYSGSERKILGIEVEYAKIKSRFAIFTTHTDHIPQSYHDTVVKVHIFVKEFLKETPQMPFVFGGDLNAFEQSGAAEFIGELRQGPFAGSTDYREGFAFYVHPSIRDTTYLGRESDGFKAKFVVGKLERNALDHLLAKNVQVVAGTRSAVVYDEKGTLVNPYTQGSLYKERLEKRRCASDHFLNAVVIRF